MTAKHAHSTEPKGAERRKHIRFNTAMEMEYKTLTLNPIFGKALAKDLSKDGVRADLKHDIPAGTMLEISLNVPGDNLPVFATGKVAWADGLAAGLKLTKISAGDRTRILEYIYSEWLKTNKKQKAGAGA
jgi:hypothetical protein